MVNIPGSYQSGQPSTEPSARKGAALEMEKEENTAFFASQESDGERKKRKASFVADPIYQKLVPPATRQRSRLRTMGR